MLKLKKIHTYYGESHALQGVDLELKKGETVCILGRNGAGKSTILKTIVGLTPAKKGNIIFEGQDITKLLPFQIARIGIGLVPEDRRVFATLTVKENLEVARYIRSDVTPTWSVERIFDEYPMLAEIANRKAGNLSGGQQQMLAVARSLMSEPKILLLDEPNEGLAPVIVQQIGELIDQLSKSTTILFTDQSTHFALKHAKRAYFLEKGKVVYSASSKELKENKELQERYLTVDG